MKKFETGKKSKHRDRRVTGVIRVALKGMGFVETPGFKEDIFVEPEHLNTALNRDEVEVAILPKGPGRLAGRVTRVLKRAKERFAGVLLSEDERFFLVPDDKKCYRDIAVSGDREDLERAKSMKVLVRMLPWTDPRQAPEGVLAGIIGVKGENGAEMMSIALEKGFETEFPEEVAGEAEKIAGTVREDMRRESLARRDFRQTLTFTIDPVDAKDFDDALSFKKLPDGRFEIGVHIADVSHFVRERASLDREARKRGFSVYLVDRTIPMLPEALSNDICSLKPNEDRLAFSAVFKMDSEGAVLERWFGKTVIRSARRFSYEEAQDVLDAVWPRSENASSGGYGVFLARKPLKSRAVALRTPSRGILGAGVFAEALETLNSIARKMRQRKFKSGAIDFEQDEMRFELDERGRPIRIYKKERLDTHKLVEEFMLLANRSVAEFIHKARVKSKSSEPFIYRVHDIPDREKISELGIFLRALGHELPSPQGRVSAKDLQMLFEKVNGRAEEAMVKTAAIRSMAKAVYSTANIGHFGLAFRYYTHFTSPIRRYADLLAHRLLSHHLNGRKIPPTEWQSYEKMARENSEREIAAAEAERASKKYKQVEYMKERVGQIFEGVISGVTLWGIYIEEKETRCEGMVKLRDLGDDFYTLDEKNYRLVGKKTGKTHSLGDSVRFKVLAADLERKTLDYGLELT